MSTEFKKQIKDHISTIESAKGIYELFRLLNYPEEYLFDETYTRKKQEFQFRSEDIERIIQIYQVMSIEGEIPVFLIETKTLSQSFIRNVTEKFDRNYRRFLLIFAEPDKHYSDILFVLPAREKVEGRYKLKLTRLNINKEEIIERNEHYTVIHILSKIQYENEDFRQLWKKWIKSFSVEKVTEEFFEDYQEIFFDLREKIKKQQIPQKEAHEFTLQLLNRIMFTYFIAKKKWLKYSNFMKWYWDEYKRNGKFGSNEFYEKWLKELFFKAFNNRQDEIVDLPENVKEVLLGFPYLNGGLFTENDNDKLNIKISDDTFKKIFEFFEKYNFTIKEDAPFNVEVAVDPQMIGYVYESLSNVAEEIYDRNDMGIFYTPRVEVDFMCRRSLVEYLSKKLPDVPKEQFYHLLFDLPEEKYKCEKYFTRENLWYDLRDALDELSVVDPACGSGAFLVGMLGVLDELYKIIYKHTNDEMTDFERKFRIIQHSLYGVDVMPWAIHAAELRLWLQLIIETEINSEELKKSPLLPNLDLNLRIGDSIVQEIGGVNINLKTRRLSKKIRKRLGDLKEQKRLYYENSRSARLKRSEDFKNAEINIFEEIINHQIQEMKRKLKFKTKESKSKQITLEGEIKEEVHKLTKREIKVIENEIKRLERVKEVIHEPGKKPFIWEIDFAEIFGENGGFDIVIGNPPYVRQEDIAPPGKLKAELKAEDKRNYKNALINAITERFPSVKIDRKSDYYIYFYFLGFNLLNEKGTLCFITSNSWLDVNYGNSLRHFISNHVPIIGFYDNPKKTFSHADVNTVISLFHAPFTTYFSNKTKRELKNNVTRFVMFKKPFESAINANNLICIEKTKPAFSNEIKEIVKNVQIKEDYRVFPILQEYLKAEDKWNSKFLIAPDIVFLILKKGSKDLIQLKFIAEVIYGTKTGANEFFFLPNKTFDLKECEDTYILIPKNETFKKSFIIDKTYLKDVLRGPRDSKKILLDSNSLKHKLFLCNINKDHMDKSIKDYVEWGEQKGFHKNVSCSKRKRWWALPVIKGKIFWSRAHHNSHRIYYSTKDVHASDNFSILKPKDIDAWLLATILNSTFVWLMKETFGRRNLGQGALGTLGVDIENLFILNPNSLKDEQIKKLKICSEKLFRRKIGSIFEESGLDPSKTIREQKPNILPDRLEIDKIIFDVLGLNKKERNEVYWAVANLVKKRIEKSNSKKKKFKC
ncbi:hypothetical protein FZP57_06130 [Methanothermobacter sp. THM-1]|uniref:Eco57I restriction-modification methylase domain-containing protein n=1 Tax=Methanothermobacter sp. THM-1 TaxID=2606911 RepID=UPI001366B275|nr:DNA methyltransferase [Methanothermobacter sp. THM-1]QHN06654.1 hypothetical protein FZP57_06130 [Methanothermobacter sp. THM-1]